MGSKSTPSPTPGTAAGLENIKLFQGISEDDLGHIAQMCQWRVWSKGAQILNRESSDRDIYLVPKGSVRIVNFSLSGREVAFATAGAGDYFGEISAIDGRERSANVVALEECHLASLGPEQFRELLEKHSIIAVRVLEKLANIVRICDDRIMDLATLSAYQRVYCELLDLKKEDPVRPDSWLVYPLPTQAQIAAKASTTRETVARVLGQLTNDGITERKGRTLYIRQLDKLEQLADRLSKEEVAAAT